jgi:ABC-2 type transport system ATP-binding protein
MNLLEVRDLRKHYGIVLAVDGISFSLEHGICMGLLGPNGAGKTTAIEVMEGVRPATYGEVLYKGKARGRAFKNEVGIQFQNTELPQYLNVNETLSMFHSLYDRRADLDYLIDICRLEEILKSDNSKISGGQKQRLLLAMALCNDPELIFLDEPTTGLDPQARRHLWEIVRGIKAQGKTIVLSTHYMEEAELLCDKICIMDHGKIIADGSPKDLLKRQCSGLTININGDIDANILDGIPGKVFKNHDGIEILTDEPNTCMAMLLEKKIDISNTEMRRQNLEDLFLKLTGHGLRS